MEAVIRFRRFGKTLPSVYVRLRSNKTLIQETSATSRGFSVYLQRGQNFRNNVHKAPSVLNDCAMSYHKCTSTRYIIHCLNYSDICKNLSSEAAHSGDSAVEIKDKDHIDEAVVRVDNVSSDTEEAVYSDDKHKTTHKENLDEAVTRLLSKAANIDVMVKSIPPDKFQNDIKQLIDVGFPMSNLDILCAFPKVFFNMSTFIELIRSLYEFGYKQNDVSALLTSKPSVMGYNASDIFESFKRLNSLGFESKRIVKVTTACPAILDMNLRTLQVRLGELRELFKTQDVFALVEKSPHVLYDGMETILEKFAYVTQEMGITQRQMMYSNLFNLPLEHLHTRHLFLVRTGFFKKVTNAKQISTNPSLDTIINTSDEAFVGRFGGLSVEEYNVFKALLKKDRVIASESEQSDDEEDTKDKQ